MPVRRPGAHHEQHPNADFADLADDADLFRVQIAIIAFAWHHAAIFPGGMDRSASFARSA